MSDCSKNLKRFRPGIIKSEPQSSEPSFALCFNQNKVTGHQFLQPLTRLDTKPRSFSPASSISSAATYLTSSPSMMTTNTDKTNTGLPVNMASEETLGLQDLELMMHWCTTTYRSMARDRAAEALWQTVIPQLSLRFTPLRHGLLALSALQVAGSSTRPDRKWRYLVSAREHQIQALAGIQIDTRDLTDPQRNAHFALCCALMVFSFAYCLVDDDIEDTDEDQFNVLDEFLEVFQLTRWLVGAMFPNIERVASGELHALVCPERTRPTMPDMSRLVILCLSRQNETMALRDPNHEKHTYSQTIEHLGNSLEQLMSGGEPKDFAFCWCFRIPDLFSELVAARKPFALIILAHYAVVLHHLRDCWWMGDWGIRIFNKIVENLDREWHEFLSWPADAMGVFLPV
ncbi:hypothetical protein N7540_004390 [Penicillium herquei]|nr:hypothetical protein N7540_004390 [Penicillium herquei]